MEISPVAALEALLFAAGEPLSKKRISSLLSMSVEQVEETSRDLRSLLSHTGLALIEADDELELRTAPEASSVVQKFRESELSRDLGKAGLEALAIILYKDGATRSEIDWIRGVNSAAALRSLTLRGLVGRSEDSRDRRRIRYTATVEALAHLGVSKLTELPNYNELIQSLNESVAEQVVEEVA